ncbi:MAG TPA: DUF4350 domain-containing protein [Pyrinomonadaceae bacterium]|nr:DUF4350 domain-containing protein [Pyrinomonadaceae bacterium]
MRQRLAIIVTIALVLGLLIAFNAASYVRVERTPDSEWSPDRSTYNSGATGTRAFYDFLSESGYKVMRWREAPDSLLKSGLARPETFVVIGETIVPFNEDEAKALLSWVESGGRLVVIDRRTDARLLPAAENWRVSTELVNYPSPDVRSSNPEEMTAGISPARTAQPTSLTHDVESVMPSRYAGLIKISSAVDQKAAVQDAHEQTGANEEGIEDEAEDAQSSEPSAQATVETETPPQPGHQTPPETESQPADLLSPAPVVHLLGDQGALLVDYTYGDGRLIVLSDPFIVANGGISRADNLRLAINIVSGAGGLIAFDEYHQGRSAGRNQLIAYFKGTPVLAMLAQAALLVLLILWTSGRRFARPLPLPHVDRRSSLEFVASMAELQQRARAYDLAIENIYTRTRRVLVRYAGLDNNSSRLEIAARVASRSSVDQQQLESLMRDCEAAINGEPVDAQRSLNLVARLREVERALGLRMRSREVRQAKEGRK